VKAHATYSTAVWWTDNVTVDVARLEVILDWSEGDLVFFIMQMYLAPKNKTKIPQH